MEMTNMERARVERADAPAAAQSGRVPPQAVSCGDGQLSLGRRMSFREAMTVAEGQAGLNGYAMCRERDLVRAMCRVMAEVYMMHPKNLIRVDGDEYEAGMVAEVFREIDPEVFSCALEKLWGRLGTVKCPRAYMRSVLYNTVFEAAFREAEAVKDAIGGGGL